MADDLELIEVPEDDHAPPPSIAPIALDASELEDDVEELELPLEKPRVRWKALAIAAVALIGVAGLAFATRSTTTVTSLATIAERTPEPPPPPAIPEPPPPPPPAPVVLPTTGTIVSPPWTKGRRVWIDGKPIAGHAPKVEAVCGKHLVKIGAYSKTKKVDIPCGGEIKLAP